MDGQVVAFSFLVTNNSVARIFVNAGATATAGYRRWGLLVQNNTIYREECVGTSACTYATLLSLTPEAWYRGKLTLDSSDRFIAEAWRVSTPGVVGVSEATHADWYGLEWKFKDFSLTSSGTQKLDDYRQSLRYGLGQRVKMEDSSGMTRWSYDRRGQPIAERKQIDSSIFYTRWGYNAAGLQSWMRYPGGAAGESGELVTMSYLPQRLQNSLVGDTTYVQGTTYDEAGRVDIRTLGSNLLQTDYDYYLWGQQGGRLNKIKSGTPADTTSLQSFEYGYYPVGNIDWIKDYNAGGMQRQVFGYDALNRLPAPRQPVGRAASTPRATLIL